MKNSPLRRAIGRAQRAAFWRAYPPRLWAELPTARQEACALLFAIRALPYTEARVRTTARLLTFAADREEHAPDAT